MENDKDKNVLNVSIFNELPGSQIEEQDLVSPREGAPRVEPTPSEGPPHEESDVISSAREEEFLDSSSSVTSVGGSQSPLADAAAWESYRRARKAEKKKRQKFRKRERAREAQAAGRPTREDQSQKTPDPQASVGSVAGASTSTVGGQSGLDSDALGKGRRDKPRVGWPSGQGGSLTASRGPRARDARRVAKRQPIVLPSAPAASRAGASGRALRGPSPSRRPTPQVKRSRGDQVTPPERRNKIAKGPARPPAARKDAHVSPLLRDAGASTSQATDVTPQVASDFVAKRELQVVIRSNRPNGNITNEEGERVRAHVVREMLRTMAGPEEGPRGPELRFRKSGLVEPGWFLITAHDMISRDWLLEGLPPMVEESVVFGPIRYNDAPWPERVGFWLKAQDFDIERVTRTLDLQNRSLNIRDWRHLGTTQGAGGWFVTFMVDRDNLKRLEEAGWELFYELVTLTARKLAWGGAPRRGIPGAKVSGPTGEAK